MASLEIVMAGASGFLGTHLRTELVRRGHRVTALVRRPTSHPDESRWDPDRGEVDGERVRAADVVINLAGSSLFGIPWSRRWARQVRSSRLRTTGLLAETIAGAAPAEAPSYLSGSAVGWYGDHGDEALGEAADSRGHSLITGIVREWEAATRPATDAGCRVVLLRTAPVMDETSMPLKQQRLQFRIGLGGRLGTGRQYQPMVSLRDWVGAVSFLAEHRDAAGPVNVCCEETPTNEAFTRALAEAVGRPAVLPVPGVALRTVTGPLAPELLGSVRTRPVVLLDLGYEFADPDVSAVVASGLS